MSHPINPRYLAEGKRVADQLMEAAFGRAAPQPDGAPSRRWFDLCPCGHSWLFHDVGEADAHGEDDLCCVEGCDQSGCPGRAAAVATADKGAEQ